MSSRKSLLRGPVPRRSTSFCQSFSTKSRRILPQLIPLASRIPLLFSSPLPPCSMASSGPLYTGFFRTSSRFFASSPPWFASSPAPRSKNRLCFASLRPHSLQFKLNPTTSGFGRRWPTHIESGASPSRSTRISLTRFRVWLFPSLLSVSPRPALVLQPSCLERRRFSRTSELRSKISLSRQCSASERSSLLPLTQVANLRLHLSSSAKRWTPQSRLPSRSFSRQVCRPTAARASQELMLVSRHPNPLPKKWRSS